VHVCEYIHIDIQVFSQAFGSVADDLDSCVCVCVCVYTYVCTNLGVCVRV